MTANNCPHCGAPIQAGALYCPNCGRRLSDEPATAQGVEAASPAVAPPAQPSAATDERTWAVVTHLAALAGFVVPIVGNIVGPLVIWLIKREEMPMVDAHGKAAVNFNISIMIYTLISVVLVVVLIGILMLLALFIFWLIMVIVAAVRASNRQDPGYVLAIRFIR